MQFESDNQKPLSEYGTEELLNLLGLLFKRCIVKPENSEIHEAWEQAIIEMRKRIHHYSNAAIDFPSVKGELWSIQHNSAYEGTYDVTNGKRSYYRLTFDSAMNLCNSLNSLQTLTIEYRLLSQKWENQKISLHHYKECELVIANLVEYLRRNNTMPPFEEHLQHKGQYSYVYYRINTTIIKLKNEQQSTSMKFAEWLAKNNWKGVTCLPVNGEHVWEQGDSFDSRKITSQLYQDFISASKQ